MATPKTSCVVDRWLCGSRAAKKASLKRGDIRWTSVNSGKETEMVKCFVSPLLYVKEAQMALCLMLEFPFLSPYIHPLKYIYFMSRKGISARIHWVILTLLGETFF